MLMRCSEDPNVCDKQHPMISQQLAQETALECTLEMAWRRTDLMEYYQVYCQINTVPIIE
jgi:hypothetical protein